MNGKQLKLLLPGLLGISLVVFVLILFSGLSMLEEKSKKLSTLKLQSRVANDQLASLAAAKKDVAQYAYFKTVAKTVLPNDKDQAQAVLDIFQLASESGISIQSITFPTSTLGLAIPTTGQAAASAVGAPSSSVLSQAKPVAGINGLYSIELAIAPESGDKVPPDKQVTYPKMLDFLNRLEHNRRTAQITQVRIQPQGTNAAPSPYINFSLSVNIFIKP